MISARVNIKPLSVNACFQGRRFKTPSYKEYEALLLLILPPFKGTKPPDRARLKLNLCIGVSSKLQDLDNVCKPFLDILTKKYGFDDRYVYQIKLEKIDVKKGAEYIEFCIEEVIK